MAPLRLSGDLGLVRQIAGATGVWTGAQGDLLFSLTLCRAFQQQATQIANLLLEADGIGQPADR